MSVSISSDFNLQRINTKEYADNLRATIDFGGSLLAIAQRGTGKTSIARDVINNSKCKEIYFNLSTMERPDLGGYPDFFNSKKDSFVNFLMPSKFRALVEGDQPCVAVLDEVDKAETGLLSPLLEFIEERSVNGFKFKNLHSIIMMGNLPSEGGTKPSAPLLDRAEKFLVEINPEHWLEWAGTAGKIHPSVAAYIADNLADLCGDVDQGENYSERSPRGWHKASKLLTYGEHHGWHPSMMMHKVAACVGRKVGIKYSAFFEHYQVLLPVVEKIMKGEKVQEFSQFENTKKLVVCMILCSRYARMLDEIKDKAGDNFRNILMPDDVKDAGKYVSKFLLNIDPEMALISIRGQLGAKRVLDHNLTDDENWDRILTELLAKIG